MQSSKNSKLTKKITSGILSIVLLSFGLLITTLALVYSMVSVDDNFFVTGRVELNLNDGKAVITEDEYIFEPGVTVKKDFFLQNAGTCEIYYKLYFKNVTGNLADILDVQIKEGDKLLFSGTPTELSRQNVPAADDTLNVNEKKTLEIYFHFPKEVGNSAQGTNLTFDLAADGVQVKNNPDKIFE